MKGILLFFLFILSALATKGQVKSKYDTLYADDRAPFNDDNFTRPSYPGGANKFYAYLAKNIHYPKNAVKHHIHGKVYLTFYIEKNGVIGAIKVIKGVSKEIDAEAVRVIKNSPKWIPGTHDGKPVRYYYSMPIDFELP